MSNKPQVLVNEGAFLTLHYRLSSADGRDILTTFGDNPATMQLGSGQLAPFLEAQLMGLPEGTHETFELTPEQAFGPRNPELLQRVALSTLKNNSDVDENYVVGDLVNFAGVRQHIGAGVVILLLRIGGG